jgi:hypothetical protein
VRDWASSPFEPYRGIGFAHVYNKDASMNGTHLSGGSVALAVGDFLELAARFGEQLVGLGASFFSPGLLPSRS